MMDRIMDRTKGIKKLVELNVPKLLDICKDDEMLKEMTREEKIGYLFAVAENSSWFPGWIPGKYILLEIRKEILK